MTIPLSLVSSAFKFVWLKYKLDKTIKKREPYIKALIKTTEGRSIQKAVLEAPGSDVVYVNVGYKDPEYLNTFEDERLLNILTRGNSNGDTIFAFKLTYLGKKYFSI